MILQNAERLVRYPVSAAQRRLWFIAQLNPTSCAYNNAHLIRLTGPLDTARLIAAFEKIVARHDSLRMRFVPSDEPGGDIIAAVDPAATIDVPLRALDEIAVGELAEREQRFVRELARAPFDLAAGPLVRAELACVGSNRYVFALVLHHIISDRWSFGVLMRELAAFYADPNGADRAAVPPVHMSYGQCSQAESADAERADAQLDYWHTVLAGERPTLELPADRARPPVPSERGDVIAAVLAPDLVRRIARVGAACKATPYMTFFAAFFVLLQRSTEQTDLLVGTPVARRGRLEREPLIGLFVNTLPVRVTVTAERSFGEIVDAVRAATLGMLAHADVPFDRLVRAETSARESGRNPFFDVLFNFHNTPAAAAWPLELSVQTEDVDVGTARIDLALTLRPQADGSMAMRIEYRADLFERATVQSLAEHFSAVLHSITAAPDRPIGQLAIAGPLELATITDRWSRSAAPPTTLPRGGATTLDELVAFTAALHPMATALREDGRQSVSYAELDRRANRLAHALRAHGVDGNARVGIYLERSIDAVVAMLATLKAGAAYVPLDPAYPPERTAVMLATAAVTAIVSRSTRFAELHVHALPLLAIDAASHATYDAHRPPAGDADAGRLAYVIFTSGSTGAAKAVGIEHRSVVAFLTQAKTLECTPADRFLISAALTFDASILLWAPLISGASVAIMPARPFSLAEFGEQIERHQITLADVSPALFHQLVDERIDCLRRLRRCTVGGDVLSPTQSARFVRAVPGCRLFNCYGPTEATVAATYHEVLPDAGERSFVPIGRPLANARIYLLDAQRQPVPIGVPGDLWIGGPGVARGYLNDPELTAERFVRDPFAADSAARMYRSGDRARWLTSGEIAFLGRSDAQVKIRGFRIEPAEIENALLEHAAVRHAAVVVRTTPSDRFLVAYVERLAAEPGERELRAFLATKLPAYALPARIVILDALPKTSSGKLDRAALSTRTLDSESTRARPAANELQQQLIGMWETLLDRRGICIDDDFFALGGHSLLAVRLIGQIERELHIGLPLSVLFERPTIEGLAAVLQRDPESLDRSPLVALNAGGSSTPLFFLHGSINGGGYYCLGLARRLGADRPLLVMRPHGVDGRPIPSAIEAMATEYIATLKSVRPQGPYMLGGFCLGGLVALEIARQLVAGGERVDNLVLVDVPNAAPALRSTVNRIGQLARNAGIPAAYRSAQRARLCRFIRKVGDLHLRAGNFLATHGKRGLVRRLGSEIRTALTAVHERRSDAGKAHATVAPDLSAAWRCVSKGYVARTYAGRVTVLLSDEYRRRPSAHVEHWPAIAPRAAIRPIPGDHFTCITQHVDTTAFEIAAALNATERS